MKQCNHPGCSIEFKPFGTRKFCDEHMTNKWSKYRQRKKGTHKRKKPVTFDERVKLSVNRAYHDNFSIYSPFTATKNAYNKMLGTP